MTGDPIDPAIFARSTRSQRGDIESILNPPRGAYPRHFVDGCLVFHLIYEHYDRDGHNGLKRPFLDRVNPSNQFRPRRRAFTKRQGMQDVDRLAHVERLAQPPRHRLRACR